MISVVADKKAQGMIKMKQKGKQKKMLLAGIEPATSGS